MEYERTVEDIESVIGHAKLEVCDLRPLSQALYFTDVDSDYRILELNSTLCEELFAKKEPLVFKGAPDEKAVICTKDATYDVKAAETSNSLLLLPGLKFAEDIATEGPRGVEKKTIVAVIKEYLEVKKCKPRLQKLRKLLEENPYTGPEGEHNHSVYSTEELLEKVQSSEVELMAALQDLDAILLDNKWRILGDDYHFRTLSYLLNLIEENSWRPDSIPIGKTIETLKELVPKQILDHIIEAYLVPSDDMDDDGDELFVLKEDKTCRFVGEYLLRPVGKFNCDDFMEAWAESVPEGLRTDPKQLQGLALFRSDLRPPIVSYFPESSLPENETERFERLFAEKALWTLAEIEPYVTKLTTEKQSVNSLLVRYCRVSNTNGTKVYSSRHGK